MNDTERDTLYIPSGLKTHTEIFDGFGKAEMEKAVVATGIAGVADFLLYLITGNTALCIIIMLTAAAGSVMMLVRDGSMNLSVVDHVRNMVRFMNV